MPHCAYLKLKMHGRNGTININGSFTLSDNYDRDFNKISKSFGM
jgi:hypothetical protein